MTVGSRIVVENEFCILRFFFLSVICWDFYTNSRTCVKKEADNPILQSDAYREKIGQLAKNSVYWSWKQFKPAVFSLNMFAKNESTVKLAFCQGDPI